jgi:hypothetical protein
MHHHGNYNREVGACPQVSGVHLGLYQKWFRYLPRTKNYYPDALMPIASQYRSRLPEPYNCIANQTAQAFWADVWIPASATAGRYRVQAGVKADGKGSIVPMEVTELAAGVPAEDAVTMDHNTYGTLGLATDSPSLSQRAGEAFFPSDRYFELSQSFHVVFYEIRGVFHQPGCGHSGKVAPEFAPRPAVTGKNKHIADWSLYDRHFGPLFDESAFAKAHLGARPAKLVYLPINPEWPASFPVLGESGYEKDLVKVVAEMERHFREKGWTRTRVDICCNPEKRYKALPWDGEEASFSSDAAYMLEYNRLLKPAIAPETPVVAEPCSHITPDVLRPWIWGSDGIVHWLATAQGPDPWFQCEGGAEAPVYWGGCRSMAASENLRAGTGRGGPMKVAITFLPAANPLWMGQSIVSNEARVQERDRVAKAAVTMVEGDVCLRIQTRRSLALPQKNDRRDPWIASDNFYVDHAAFIQTKKTLTGLARLCPEACDANLWMPVEASTPRIPILLRNVYEKRSSWPWGDLHQAMPDEIKRAPASGERGMFRGRKGLISALAPVCNSLDNIVALVEVVGQGQRDLQENVK